MSEPADEPDVVQELREASDRTLAAIAAAERAEDGRRADRMRWLFVRQRHHYHRAKHQLSTVRSYDTAAAAATAGRRTARRAS